METRNGAFDARAILRQLAVEDDLDGVDFRVILYLFSRLDFQNFTLIEQSEIVEALQKRKEHISRSIQKLKQKNILIEATPRIGRSHRYILNPNYGK